MPRALLQKLASIEFDLLVTAETKSIPLAHSMAVHANKPYVILRKSYKVYMGKAQQVETLSITTGSPQILVLDEKDARLVKGKRVVIVDDVVSTGSTLDAMRKLMSDAGALWWQKLPSARREKTPPGRRSSTWANYPCSAIESGAFRNNLLGKIRSAR